MGKRYTKPILAWTALFLFFLLAFVVLIAIETLTRDYPKWQWWMGTVPVHVFSDAFVPVVFYSLLEFAVPMGLIALVPVLTYKVKGNIAQRLIEIIWYLLSIGMLWFSFWVIGFFADCQMLTLESDGGPWGPCGYWAAFSRPTTTFIWHTVLWVLWSIVLIAFWRIVKRKLLSNGNVSVQTLEAA